MSVFVSREDIMSELGWEQCADHKLECTAFVTETLTSTTFNDTTEIKAMDEKIKINILSQPEVAKPGLKYLSLVSIFLSKLKFCITQYTLCCFSKLFSSK